VHLCVCVHCAHELILVAVQFLSRQMEARVQQREASNAAQAALAANAKWEQSVRATAASDERVERLRNLREQQQQQRELQTLASLELKATDRELREREREQEERLAAVLAEKKHAHAVEMKRRQMLREISPELRALEQQLQAAYVSKERSAQIAERAVQDERDFQRESAWAEHIAEETRRAERLEAERTARSKVQQSEYNQQLARQLDEKDLKRQQAYDEFLREKALIDDAVQRLLDEDRKEQEKRIAGQAQLRQHIADFQEQRKQWQRQQENLIRQENERIAHFAKEQETRRHDLQAKKMADEVAKESVYSRLAVEIDARQRELEEMERVRTDFYQEEQAERARLQEKEDIERKLRMRMQLREAHEFQHKLKEERSQAEQREEEEFRQRMLAKFAEDERLEQMNAQKRRMRELEHRRMIERMITERREQRTQERARQTMEAQEERDRTDAFRRAVEEERQRLLREHAERLIGFLPPGVIRSEADLQGLPETVRQAFARTRREHENPYEDTTCVSLRDASNVCSVLTCFPAPWTARHDYTVRRK
jgi:hypothetical protein